MPKWLLFGLAAIADFVIAFLAYQSGRVVIPAILAFAGVCFIFAAIGSAAKGKGDVKS